MPPELVAPSPKQIESGTETPKMLTPGKVYKWD